MRSHCFTAKYNQKLYKREKFRKNTKRKIPLNKVHKLSGVIREKAKPGAVWNSLMNHIIVTKINKKNFAIAEKRPRKSVKSVVELQCFTGKRPSTWLFVNSKATTLILWRTKKWKFLASRNQIPQLHNWDLARHHLKTFKIRATLSINKNKTSFFNKLQEQEDRGELLVMANRGLSVVLR